MAAPDDARKPRGGASGAPQASERARRILERSGLGAAAAPVQRAPRAFVRAESEDDDGYDPYSDRPAAPEATYQADPWA